ncbi:MAG: hypothetical protein K6G87_13740 [Butyrivibrio sp.]|uniref:hypothetical protein n=1 Tax=Butyrivibrio sp. TaxID=28121 RepID=UPI0025D0DC2B|nr:hypothetical protein [Butyrivibrio sp.]MCR5772279.1 hypothetical protein [Butyrivibrio sp.]
MSDDDNMEVQDEENLENASDKEENDVHPEMWKDPRVENIVRAIRKNEKAKNKNEIIKVNYKVLIDPKTKLIAPFVTLLGTAVIAVFTYFDGMPTSRWFIVVCTTTVLFLLFGSILQNMIEKYEEEAVKQWIDKRLEQERLLDEEKARREAEELIAQAKAAAKQEEDLFF